MKFATRKDKRRLKTCILAFANYTIYSKICIEKEKIMKSNNNMLKVLAMRAKNRMINRNGMSDARIKIINNDDGEFVEKVRDILSSQDNITNPIGQLMEEKVLFKLDEKGKEKYLLETVEKFLRAKTIIENEKIG